MKALKETKTRKKITNKTLIPTQTERGSLTEYMRDLSKTQPESGLWVVAQMSVQAFTRH